MELKIQIILGILLASFSASQVKCASVQHYFRPVREVDLPPNSNESVTIPTSTTNKDVIPSTSTQSSLSTVSNKPPDSKEEEINNNETVDKKVNKVEPISDDLSSKESVKTIEESKQKKNVTRGTVKYKSEEQIDDKSEEPKATGRSLNIDIDKYVSPEFHNRNNVYSLPTSPEIEKYIEPEDFSHEESISPKKTFTSQTTINEYNYDLTTPPSTIFDSKFQTLVDGIKQNLDELTANIEENEKADNDTSKYEISKLVDNYKNADNDTDVSLETKEFKNIDIKTDDNTGNKGNKGVESGKSVNYESTYLKTQTFGDPENSDKPKDSKQESSEQSTTTLKPSTTFIPSKKPRYQISLRNNTIETTAPDSALKQKKYYESSSLDPLYETYSKPVYENAINVSKRGSVKFTGSTDSLNISSTPSFIDFDKKNFSIPPTASAWTLVSLKDVPSSSTPSMSEGNITDSVEQNSQENNLVKVQITPPTKKEDNVDGSNSTDNVLSTTKYYKISSSALYDFTTITSKDELIPTTINDEFTSTEEVTDYVSTTTEPDELTTKSTDNNPTETIENMEESTEVTTDYKFSTTTENIEHTTDSSTTESATTEFQIIQETSTDIYTTSRAETDEYVRGFRDNFETTESVSSTSNLKQIPSKTESENELYTTLKPMTSSDKSEEISTTAKSITQKLSTTTSADLEPFEKDPPNNITSDIDVNKNSSYVNDPDIEIIPIDNIEHSSTTTLKATEVITIKLNESTTPSMIIKEHKSAFDNNNNISENVTVDSTSSTELLAHDDGENDSNAGKIAAIAISSVGGVCLILLAGLLLIMRKRQKRVTYGQRCRPVSLDAYSLDNVSVYNSVRRKGALRASKRSYGNPAFDDPVSISHQMNFQSLVKFAENSEQMSAEFDEIPQVTARANEVPVGCETKNRYANVIPLPETRVILKAFDNDPQSDYINANYVTGPKNTRGYYIACQAPMQNTVDDFWRMVWEQQCRVVLMLTNLYENGIEKCADYLPPSEVLDCHRLFGDFQITLKKREVKEKYIISSLQLKNMVSNSWREVTHLWYLGWPERGVPLEANSLIAFLIEARSHLKTASNNNSNDDKTSESCNIYISNASTPGTNTPEGGPMVVHCSPGTGRTGTVIACDIAIRDFELTRSVDVPKIVYRVRRDRASAVQTRDQYAFIYKVISLYSTKLTGGALDSI